MVKPSTCKALGSVSAASLLPYPRKGERRRKEGKKWKGRKGEKRKAHLSEWQPRPIEGKLVKKLKLSGLAKGPSARKGGHAKEVGGIIYPFNEINLFPESLIPTTVVYAWPQS